jgi:predicted metal-dependent hydrolase
MQVNANLKFQWMVSKWGVCDYHKKQVTLALQLGSCSQDVVDYVIVHELAHLYQPNHSSKFWDVVKQYLPAYKQLIKKIKLDD